MKEAIIKNAERCPICKRRKSENLDLCKYEKTSEGSTLTFPLTCGHGHVKKVWETGLLSKQEVIIAPEHVDKLYYIRESETSEGSYSVFARGIVTNSGERYCVTTHLSYEQAEAEVERLKAEGLTIEGWVE